MTSHRWHCGPSWHTMAWSRPPRPAAHGMATARWSYLLLVRCTKSPGSSGQPYTLAHACCCTITTTTRGVHVPGWPCDEAGFVAQEQPEPTCSALLAGSPYMAEWAACYDLVGCPRCRRQRRGNSLLQSRGTTPGGGGSQGTGEQRGGEAAGERGKGEEGVQAMAGVTIVSQEGGNGCKATFAHTCHMDRASRQLCRSQVAPAATASHG